MSLIKALPDLRARGSAQMALDAGLQATAVHATARRYLWAPAALSLGKFQKVTLDRPLPFDVVRRPTGGRAVLHGDEFEWSFAVVLPPALLDARGAAAVETPYGLITSALVRAFDELGVRLAGESPPGRPYQMSSLCFATALPHDLFVEGHKVVAVAQARSGGRVLVHGSVLERRPPRVLTEAVTGLLREDWVGDGLAGAGLSLPRDEFWLRFLSALELSLQTLIMSGDRLQSIAVAGSPEVGSTG